MMAAAEYDIFLSFKNSDERGQVTPERQLAAELFRVLTDRGLRVFFSEVTLEQEGVDGYKKVIDRALDSAHTLVAIGTSLSHLEAHWVRYEWDSFCNDILSGLKPDGRVFVYVEGIPPSKLPRSLRQFQCIQHGPDSVETIYRFIANAPARNGEPPRTEERPENIADRTKELERNRSPDFIAPRSVGGTGSVKPGTMYAYRRWVIAALGLVLIGMLGFVAWRTLKPKASVVTPPIVQGLERTLTYWLRVQRNNGQPAFESIGPEILVDAGSHFWFNVETRDAGALYLFSYGNDSEGKPSEVNTLFPTPENGQGDASIASNQKLEVTKRPVDFRNGSGVIVIWIVWSKSRLPELDDLVKKSYDTGGTIKGANREAWLAFIQSHQAPKPETVKDKIRFRSTMKGRSEIMVDSTTFEYHP